MTEEIVYKEKQLIRTPHLQDLFKENLKFYIKVHQGNLCIDVTLKFCIEENIPQLDLTTVFAYRLVDLASASF